MKKIILLAFFTIVGISNIIHAQTGIFSVKDYGAKGDGKTLDTKAIQKAIDAVARKGGGTVFLNPGTYLSGTIILKSNIIFEIGPGAVLKGSGNIEDYRKSSDERPKGLIWGEEIENVVVKGTGVIDANGEVFFDLSTPRPLLNPSFDATLTRQGLDYGKGVADDEGTVMGEGLRPWHTVSFGGCKNVRLESFTLLKSPFWAVELNGCEDAVVTGIRIRNNQRIPNSDGINIKSCRNVRISDCDIVSGDDAIVISTNATDRRDPGWHKNFPGPCTDVVVSNCILNSRSKGFLIWADAFDVERVVATNLVLVNCNRGITFCYNSGDIRDVIVSNSIVKTHITTGNWWGKAEPIIMYHHNGSKNPVTSTSIIENITFSNIRSISEGPIVLWAEVPGNIRNIAIRDLDLTLVMGENVMAYGGNFDFRGHPDMKMKMFKHDIPGIFAQGVDGLKLNGIRIERSPDLPDFYKEAFDFEGVSRLKMNEVETIGFDKPGKKVNE